MNPQTVSLTVLLQRVLDERRIRHDHAYSIEVGPHHCPGCDLVEDIETALQIQTRNEIYGDFCGTDDLHGPHRWETEGGAWYCLGNLPSDVPSDAEE